MVLAGSLSELASKFVVEANNDLVVSLSDIERAVADFVSPDF